MEKIELPVVEQSTSVQRALDTMRERDKRAVVVAPAPSLFRKAAARLFLNRDLVYAKLYGVERCADVRGGYAIALLDTDPGVGRRAESVLDKHRAHYAVVRTALENSTAIVTTRHEEEKRAIESAVRICVCTSGDPDHTLEERVPPPMDGQPCELMDGHRLECY